MRLCQAGPLCLSPRWARTSMGNLVATRGDPQSPHSASGDGEGAAGLEPLCPHHRACGSFSTPWTLPSPHPWSWQQGGTRPDLAVPPGLGCAAGLAACPCPRTPQTHRHGAAGTGACSRARHGAVLEALGKQRGGGGGGSEEGSPPSTCPTQPLPADRTRWASRWIFPIQKLRPCPNPPASASTRLPLRAPSPGPRVHLHPDEPRLCTCRYSKPFVSSNPIKVLRKAALSGA